MPKLRMKDVIPPAAGMLGAACPHAEFLDGSELPHPVTPLPGAVCTQRLTNAKV